MSLRRTTIADRNQFVDLKLQGHPLREIAKTTRWSFECVRYWWRRYREGGRRALDPAPGGPPADGPMSSFPHEVQTAFITIKEQHPGWGAPVARPRVAEQLGVSEVSLPCLSTIEKYWRVTCPELLRSYRTHPPLPEAERIASVEAAHERWQMDFKEWIAVDGCGHIDVLNIRDEATPVKVGSFVYPAHSSTGRDIQAALRTAFTQWGLCDRLQSDRDKRLFNSQLDYPFPTVVLLWLAGLDIQHDIAPSAQANGCVERFNQTWYERVVRGCHFDSLAQLQATSDRELARINQKLPSRGRACAGRPPLVAYPQAATPRRAFCRQSERMLFSLQRVYDYLAQQFWWRRVSKVGQVSLGGHRYGVGMAHARQDVRITFDAETAEFVIHSTHEQLIKRLSPKHLTAAHIMGLDFEEA